MTTGLIWLGKPEGIKKKFSYNNLTECLNEISPEKRRIPE